MYEDVSQRTTFNAIPQGLANVFGFVLFSVEVKTLNLKRARCFREWVPHPQAAVIRDPEVDDIPHT